MLTLNRLFIFAILGAICLVASGVKTNAQSHARMVEGHQVFLAAATSKPIRNIRKKINEKPSAQVAKA